MAQIQSPNTGTGFGIAGLVIGIISLPLAIIPCTTLSGLILSTLAIGLSATGYSLAKRDKAPTSMLLAALIISVIAASISGMRMYERDFKKPDWASRFEQKIDRLEELEHASDNFGEAFEEEFERELGGSLEEVLGDLEGDLDDLEEDIENEFETAFDDLSDEEKARKLGKAAGKALKSFVEDIEEMVDTSNIHIDINID